MLGRAIGGFFLTLVFAVGVSVPDAWAQLEGGRTILGSIRVGEGSLPKERARVRLFNTSGALQQEVHAETSGSFSFNRLKAGEYFVEVALHGFETVRQPVSVLPLAQYRATILIALQPEEPRGAAPTGGVLDARIPAPAREHWEKALEELRANRPDQARKHLEKAVKAVDHFAAGFRLLGLLAVDEGQLDKAESFANRARGLEPDDPQGLILQGTLWNRRNRHSDALPVLEKGVVADPRSWRGHFELAQAHFALKDFSRALPHARKALETRGGPYPEAHVLLANVLINLRQYPEAAQHLSTFLKLAPDSPSAPPAREVLRKMKEAGVSVP